MPTKYTYTELFAGAGGLSTGLEMAGFEAFAHAEIDNHARAVLRKHWPDCRLDGDVSKVDGRDYKGITLLSGGSPCQDLSIAGKRAGMSEGSGTRSSLYFEQVRIWQESEAPYFLWENVLGALSSNNGRDFAAVLSAIVGATLAVPDDGWGSAGVASGPTGVAAWRVLDAQYFGVPQRRRRVFVLGARAGGVDPAEVLSVSESVSGYPASRREAGEGTPSNTGAGVGEPRIFAQNTRFAGNGVFPSLQAAENSGQQQQAVLTYEWHNQDSRIKEVDVASTLNLNAEGREGHIILPLTAEQQVFTKTQYGAYEDAPSVGATLGARDHASLNTDLAVGVGIPRRLTPIECERLMGWADGHTAYGIDENGKEYALADTARYKLCGNGCASPVAAWIAFRLRDALDAS